MRKITSSDIFDINKKTGALILGKKRLDDYATKFLAKYCRQALSEPMPLPVDDIIKDMGLKVQEASLSSNLDVFGCCLLLDSTIEIFNHDTTEFTTTAFKAGTILIDPQSEAFYGEGAKRNTLMHEAIHWEKDKQYFRILEIKNKNASEKLYPILCRKSGTFFIPPEGKKTKENEVKWLEWQAHRLAPRILMPKNTFKKKAIEVIEGVVKNDNCTWPCDSIIEELSLFFIVSRSSVKYRLLEVDLKNMIEGLVDFNTIYADIIEESDKTIFSKLSPIEAYQLLEEDQRLRGWVDNGSFIFVGGYFIKNSKELIAIKEDGSLSLKEKAQRNLMKYAINIVSRTFKSYPNFNKDILEFSYLNRTIGVADKRIAIFDPKFQSRLEYDIDSAYSGAADDLTSGYKDEIEIAKLISDPTKSLCECLWGIMEYRKWQYPKTFTENTLLYDDLFGKIRRNEQNTMSKETLLAICVGLKLKLFQVEELMGKRGISLKRFDMTDYVYMRIFERFPGISIHDFNGMLEIKNIEPLGTK